MSNPLSIWLVGLSHWLIETRRVTPPTPGRAEPKLGRFQRSESASPHECVLAAPGDSPTRWIGKAPDAREIHGQPKDGSCCNQQRLTPAGPTCGSISGQTTLAPFAAQRTAIGQRRNPGRGRTQCDFASGMRRPGTPAPAGDFATGPEAQAHRRRPGTSRPECGPSRPRPPPTTSPAPQTG
jgi:hypothetical protein